MCHTSFKKSLNARGGIFLVLLGMGILVPGTVLGVGLAQDLSGASGKLIQVKGEAQPISDPGSMPLLARTLLYGESKRYPSECHLYSSRENDPSSGGEYFNHGPS